jgi:hypothetical protein
MELTLAMWQGEEVTKMDPGKVAVCLGPNLLKRKSDVGFCDFSYMFFEMAQHIDEIFGDIKVPRYFPENFYDYLSELDGNTAEDEKVDIPEPVAAVSPKQLSNHQSSEKTGRALPPPKRTQTTLSNTSEDPVTSPEVSSPKAFMSDEETAVSEPIAEADQATKGSFHDDDEE